jgi:hypothetical protein
MTAVFRDSRVLRISPIAGKADGGCDGAMDKKPSTAQFAFSTGINGVDRNPVANLQPFYAGTKLNYFA